MQNGIFFSMISLIYCWIIALLFTFKEKIKTSENFLYGVLVFLTIIGLNLEIFIALRLGYGLFSFVNESIILFLNKLLIVYMISWLIILTYYVIRISIKNEEIIKVTNFMSILLFILTIVLSFVLPIEINSAERIAYSSGPVTSMAYVFCSLLELICTIAFIVGMTKYKIKFSKYYPIVTFIILGFIFMIIQHAVPELTLMLSIHSIVIYIMYFTIENPDMKLIAQLNEAKSQAEKANNAKSDFLSSMSHEIRTPLNAIVGFSQALQEENLPELAKGEVQDIVAASETLLEIVNSILDISKIEANKLEIIDKEYSFRKIYDELCALTKARLGEKPLELRFSYDDTIPQVLYGDNVRIKQVILNLLTNSVKYTKEGFVDFSVKSVVKDDVCRLIVSVEDSGIGIKKENLKKLFTKFERFDEKNTTIEGTGLGLAITKRLVELMHGQLIVHSVFGEGSKFTLVIDQKIVKGATTSELEAQAASNFIDIDCTGKEILLVDDNKLNLKVACRLLEVYKSNITTLESGIEAIDLIKSGKTFDLILMDDMMPKKSGVETLQELKQIEGYNIPTVILTANAIEGMREKYLNDGFDDYLSKPIDKMELNRVINRFLNK